MNRQMPATLFDARLCSIFLVNEQGHSNRGMRERSYCCQMDDFQLAAVWAEAKESRVKRHGDPSVASQSAVFCQENP